MKEIKHLILIFGRWLAKIAKRICVGSSHRQVLFVGESQLMVAYLKEVWQRLKDDDRLSLRVAFDCDIDPHVIAKEMRQFEVTGNKIRRVHYWLAMIWPWDMIVFADCTKAWIAFSNVSKKLWIPHGITAGKLSRRSGKIIEWDEWLWKKDKTPAFDMIFVINEKSKIDLERECPAYVGRIACVGDLRFDNLLEVCKKREKIKKYLDIPQDRKIVLCISSWGPKSLLHTVGTQLYQECSNLSDKYHFIITAHPNNYDRDKSWIDVVQKHKSWGATVLEPNEDYVSSLSIADVLITDFTSLSLYFVPLLRPIISIPIPLDVGAPGSNMYKMESISTRLESPGKLRDALEIALSSEISDQHRAFAKELVAHQGEAWIEMRKRIYELLSLSEQESI
ncbi:MAG: CDP-glycerol glycerophosphotransferase family protein [Sedimentisphaerales bacterium]|nr:CDP-glycerol glycerophosphotransferase family protein [Sedimentisphaerales bacterium]